MAEDRSWMYTGRQSKHSITPEWVEKTTEFVERAFRRVPQDHAARGVLCPCASCRNRRTQSKLDMQLHLGKNGFQPDYTLWVRHGESRNGRTAKPSDDQHEYNGTLEGEKDVEVAGAGAGEQVPKPQRAKKREISDLYVYAYARILRKEDRIEWQHEYQRYLWEKEKLQQQRDAPKRLCRVDVQLAFHEGEPWRSGIAAVL